MDVFDLVAKITLDSSEYEKQVKNLEKDADSGGTGWVGKIGKGLGGIAKVGAGAFGVIGAAATAAAVAIGKSAIDGYKEYEQLEGGVKKLFGDEASKTVMKYAENAYKTAGMSANEYMETATSFSASLIQSLGGDTQKAAEIADVAMSAMSDNVNTFGGDFSNVQNAFQGFAKQNYTMLDNLKLGYGGTKTEMERLIKDANKYRKAQGKNADLTIDSFADIVEAIQTVQEKQGIAGTTAKEAMTTIEGSATATKAAWKNVLTAIAGGGDLKKAMKGLTESLFGSGDGGGFINQIIPRIKETMEGVAEFIGQAAPLIAEKLPELVTAIVPSVLSAAGSIMKALASAMPNLLKAVWNSVKAAAPALLEAVKSAFSSLGTALGSVLSSIGSWISSNAGTLLEKGKELFGNVVTGIGNAIGTIGSTLGDIISAVGGWVMEHGSELLAEGENLLNWVISGIKSFISHIPEALANIISAVTGFVTEHGSDFLSAGENLLNWIISGIKSFITHIPEALANIVSFVTGFVTEHGTDFTSAGENLLNWVISGIKSFISNIPDALAGIVSSIIGWVSEHSSDFLAAGQTILSWITSGIKKWIENIKQGFSDAVSKVGEWVTSVGQDLINKGKDIIDWITSGISQFIGRIKLGFTDTVSKIGEKITNIGTNLKNIGGDIVDWIKGGISGFMSRIKSGFSGMTGEIESEVNGTVVTDKLKELGGKIVDGIAAGISGIQKISSKIGTLISNAITNATSKTYNANVKIAAQTGYKKGSEGDLPQAKALHKPYLFNKATVFGRYQDRDLIAGEAGPEMLLGVNKLNAMLMTSVQGGMQAAMGTFYDMASSMQTGGGSERLQQEIINVLNTYLPQLARMQVVLDTGTVAGAISPSVDENLGTTYSNKTRYSA